MSSSQCSAFMKNISGDSSGSQPSQDTTPVKKPQPIDITKRTGRFIPGVSPKPSTFKAENENKKKEEYIKEIEQNQKVATEQEQSDSEEEEEEENIVQPKQTPKKTLTPTKEKEKDDDDEEEEDEPKENKEKTDDGGLTIDEEEEDEPNESKETTKENQEKNKEQTIDNENNSSDSEEEEEEEVVKQKPKKTTKKGTKKKTTNKKTKAKKRSLEEDEEEEEEEEDSATKKRKLTTKQRVDEFLLRKKNATNTFKRQKQTKISKNRKLSTEWGFYQLKYVLGNKKGENLPRVIGRNYELLTDVIEKKGGYLRTMHEDLINTPGFTTNQNLLHVVYAAGRSGEILEFIHTTPLKDLPVFKNFYNICLKHPNKLPAVASAILKKMKIIPESCTYERNLTKQSPTFPMSHGEYFDFISEPEWFGITKEKNSEKTQN